MSLGNGVAIDAASPQHLLSLPPAMTRAFGMVFPDRRAPEWFAASDPEGASLGSGGGTAHLLAAAWRAEAGSGGASFSDWLASGRRKLVLHGGGQGRRLPAYAAVGKPFIPLPVLRGGRGERLDQTLLDFQLSAYRRVLGEAPRSYVVLVTSGDVLLRFGDLPLDLPAVDVLAFGMEVTPEVAQNFGVFFAPPNEPNRVAFFLQKPDAARIRALSAAGYHYLVDTGMWLLSEQAVQTLMARCGWDESTQRFASNDDVAAFYELYAELGLGLGSEPDRHDPLVAALSCATIALPRAEFYHLGTSRQLIESVTLMQNRGVNAWGRMGLRHHPDQYVQNAVFEQGVRPDANHTLWIENAHIPASWKLAHGHVLSGIPDNAWDLSLEPNVCLDVVPVGTDGNDLCVRVYGLDDPFRGPLGEPDTRWLGRGAADWFAARGIDLARTPGLDPATDIQQATLFPVLGADQLASTEGGAFVQWLFAAAPSPDARWAAWWRAAPRLSAQQIGVAASVERLHRERARRRCQVIPRLHRNHKNSVFFQLDLQATGTLLYQCDDTVRADLPPPLPAGDATISPLTRMKDEMFRASVLSRARGGAAWPAHEAAAFAWLRESVVEPDRLVAHPTRTVLDDQIIWGRSPVRLDLAGGWTDTPPFCLEHGGKVVNVAVDINGQPPIQVFARPCDAPHLIVRSIDLGVEERIETWDQLSTFARAGSEFALAKAALALSGFSPTFGAGERHASLVEQLQAFGGGIEVSMLAATPKGSGLGTSSILAATLLATLGDLCGLRWDNHDLVYRSLVIEQMLTTGGGWQDPAGGIFKGIKLVEAAPGGRQNLSIRWLPEHLFAPEHAGRTMLLYYTGLTRLAKTILQDIVRGMFLGAAPVLSNLAEIGHNADAAYRAIQAGDYDALCQSVRRSWTLNQRLDAGTNPPAVQAILDAAGGHVAAAKLLGAGGGGYLLLLARDERGAVAIRERLTERPPNTRARFVDFSISKTGLQVTRS